MKQKYDKRGENQSIITTIHCLEVICPHRRFPPLLLAILRYGSGAWPWVHALVSTSFPSLLLPPSHAHQPSVQPSHLICYLTPLSRAQTPSSCLPLLCRSPPGLIPAFPPSSTHEPSPRAIHHPPAPTGPHQPSLAALSQASEQRQDSRPRGRGCPGKLDLIFEAPFPFTPQSSSNHRHITPSQGCLHFRKGTRIPALYPSPHHPEARNHATKPQQPPFHPSWEPPVPQSILTRLLAEVGVKPFCFQHDEQGPPAQQDGGEEQVLDDGRERHPPAPAVGGGERGCHCYVGRVPSSRVSACRDLNNDRRGHGCGTGCSRRVQKKKKKV